MDVVSHLLKFNKNLFKKFGPFYPFIYHCIILGIDIKKSYLDCIHEALDITLCIRYFPSQTMERQSRPEVCLFLKKIVS